MTKAQYEAALQGIRNSLLSIAARNDQADPTSKMETDVAELVKTINDSAKSLVDKRKIATQLRTDASVELADVGKSDADQSLKELDRADKKQKKQYIFEITTLALKEFEA